jgi:serine protease AprX
MFPAGPNRAREADARRVRTGEGGTELPGGEQHFNLSNFVIAPNLKREMGEDPNRLIPVIISFQEPNNKSNPAVLAKREQAAGDAAEGRKADEKPGKGIAESKQIVRNYLRDLGFRSQESDFYLFARLNAAAINKLAEEQKLRIYQIWKDDEVNAHLLTSTNTIKASACWRTFDARGKGITWAVLDTGINPDHPHFKNGTINFDLSCSCLIDDDTIEDKNGHGTHVAGIVAGAPEKLPDGQKYKWVWEMDGQAQPTILDLDGCPSGVAPLATLVIVKVLNADGSGQASAVIRGLEYLRKKNQESRDIKIDGANLSLGVPFNPKLYGCGHSPLCEEVIRAVRSGIVVVVSSGNEGYGHAQITETRQASVSYPMSIADPANAEDAISVGSVHKGSPHKYGVSYFSSKGPTSDGRMKPDLVAPGEKVVSCSLRTDAYQYQEMSGTSMAAPHVSGAIAAFLSIHQEYRGNPRAVKEIFMKAATDLGRDRNVQGAGLVDLMRAVMSV